jgi:hypothetical protein
MRLRVSPRRDGAEIPLPDGRTTASIEASGGHLTKITRHKESIMVVDPITALWLDRSRRAEMKRQFPGSDDQLPGRTKKRSRKK